MTTPTRNPNAAPAGPRVLATIAVAFAVMVVGWRLCWHLADDAFITYRYISNAMAGRGLVWNPPPFLPVDGNTDFLWSMLLLAVWKTTGVMPPDIANWLTFAFGTVTFLLLARAVWRVALPERLERVRPVLLGLSLALLVTNRGWLATLSSGLGIASFNASLFAWSLLAVSGRTVDAPRRWLGLGALAAACGLGRPEGLLVVVATAVLVLWWGIGARPRRLVPAGAAASLACVPVACHLVWRRVTTGDWLPCTYYAKTLGAWPESGVRYLASFLVEFGVYVWLACAVVWLVARVRSPGPLALVRRANLGASAVAAVFVYHFAYYTFYMGGDLFEWRVYTHLIPWLPLSLVVMLRGSLLRPGAVVAVFATWLALALPIGWIKFAVDDEDVAPHLPALLRPLVEPYDEWQRWLGDRAVCKRNHEMKVNLTAFVHAAPAREVGERVSWEGFPIIAATAVGVLGWTLPNVAIVDEHGLNDAVIARHPIPSSAELLAQRVKMLRDTFALFDHDKNGRVGKDEFQPWFQILRSDLAGDPQALDRTVAAEIARFDVDGDQWVTTEEYLERARPHGDRVMAHERSAPPGYVEGFRPNVFLEGRNVRVEPRAVPMTEAEIREHEARFRDLFGVPR